MPTGQASLRQTTALVTGASSGIGEAIANELARQGTGRIILVARRQERLEAIAQELGPRAVLHVADLTQPQQVQQLIRQWPEVDLLVNNAGFGWGQPLDQQLHNVDRLLEMIDLNCRAVVQLTGGYLGRMLEQDKGWILNVGSIAGMLPIPYMSVYTGTKGFVHHFTEALRMELNHTGVGIHLLAPGPVETEFFRVSRPEAEDRPMGDLFLSPDRVAKEAIHQMLNDRPRHVPDWRMRLGFGFLSHLPKRIQRPLSQRLFARAQQMVERTR